MLPLSVSLTRAGVAVALLASSLTPTASVGVPSAWQDAGRVVTAPTQEARAAGVSTSWSAVTVRRGSRVSVRGAVRQAARPRAAVLQVRSGKRWVKRAGTTTVAGRYRLSVPTSSYGAFTYRVLAPVTRKQRRAGLRRGVSAPQVITVVRTAATAPRASADYTLIHQDPARWNPCSTITYRVNTKGAPSGALADTKGAMARIAQATGLTLQYGGSTTLVPDSTNGENHPDGTQIVVAWAGREQSDLISSDRVAGVGGPVGRGGKRDANGREIIMWEKGTVVLNTSFNWLPAGFGHGATRGKLLMHEIGHVVGLGHASGQSQVMFPTLQRDYATAWGTGDLAGLRAQGATHGCITNRDGSAAFYHTAAGASGASPVTVDHAEDVLGPGHSH